jgi:hypothetical protein
MNICMTKTVWGNSILDEVFHYQQDMAQETQNGVETSGSNCVFSTSDIYFKSAFLFNVQRLIRAQALLHK